MVLLGELTSAHQRSPSSTAAAAQRPQTHTHTHTDSMWSPSAAWTNSGSLSDWRGSCVSPLFCTVWTSQSDTHTHTHTHKAAWKAGACQRWFGHPASKMCESTEREREREREEKKRLCAACCTLEGTCVLMHCSDLCNTETLLRKYF